MHNIKMYYDLGRFSTLLPQERASAAAPVPQLEGEDRNERGWVVELESGNYEWEPDPNATQSAQDYIDALGW